MRIELYQQDTLSINDSRLALFCHKLPKDALVVLPEYTLNPFFTALCKQSQDEILAHSTAQIISLEAWHKSIISTLSLPSLLKSKTLYVSN